jgi:hypothetical protein
MGNIQCESGFSIYSLTPSATNSKTIASWLKSNDAWLPEDSSNMTASEKAVEIWKNYTHLLITGEPTTHLSARYQIAYGLCQWIGRSKELIQDFVVEAGLDENSPKEAHEEVQVAFLLYDLEREDYFEGDSTGNPLGYSYYYMDNIYNGKKLREYSMLEILKDEECLRQIGLWCLDGKSYNTEHHGDRTGSAPEKLFKEHIADHVAAGDTHFSGVYDLLEGEKRDAALKVLGASEVILHAYEIPEHGSQEAKGQYNRGNASMTYYLKYGAE